MKILLIYISGAKNRDDLHLNVLPAGLCYLQASLREAGFDAILGNFSGYPDSQIRQQLIDQKPEIVGISQWTHNRHASLALARTVRLLNPRSLVIMGGAHATFQYDQILVKDSPVDIVVLGEGEETIKEIVSCQATGNNWCNVKGLAYSQDGKIIVNPQRDVLADLDRIPYQSLYLEHSIGVNQPSQAEFILTARGCPSSCHFCSSPGFWNRRVRFRSPANIVDEILYVRDRFGVIYFSIRDDTFTADRQRTIDFCKLLIKSKAYVIWNCQSRVSAIDEELLEWMLRAGCECIQLGIESGSPHVLDMLGKAITPAQVEQAAAMIRNAGINLSAYLISDVPGESEKDISQTIELINRIRPDDGYVSPLAYYPGTRLFEEACATGRIDRKIFAMCSEAAVYASKTPGKNAGRILKCLANSAPDNTYRFRQKNKLSYCYTTNVLYGEWYRQNGDGYSAEQKFLEITANEADNPWGWYLLGELYRELGKREDSNRCYQRVLDLVPMHTPSRSAVAPKLKAKKRRGQVGPA